jgi:gliding motility-associated peptidyl-prolyl isomerase
MKLLKFIIIALLFSCSENEPRYAVKHNKKSIENPSILKSIISEQNQKIDNYLSKNPDNNYINSKRGFWYYYKKKNDSNDKSPEFGDSIIFDYSIANLNNNIIYDYEAIGEQSYIMEKQQIITGIREALKILKKDEIATFIIPSYIAYGMYGDLNKIPPNTTIICTIKVKSINSTKN